MSKPPLVYLACPYTHHDPVVRRERFDAVNRVAGELIGRGLHVFSPISHSHPIAEACGLPTDANYWYQYDLIMLSCCDKLLVLMLDGWAESAGVRMEIEMAQDMTIPIFYITPHDNMEK